MKRLPRNAHCLLALAAKMYIRWTLHLQHSYWFGMEQTDLIGRNRSTPPALSLGWSGTFE
jgi:hypothetical protein